MVVDVETIPEGMVKGPVIFLPRKSMVKLRYFVFVDECLVYLIAGYFGVSKWLLVRYVSRKTNPVH